MKGKPKESTWCPLENLLTCWSQPSWWGAQPPRPTLELESHAVYPDRLPQRCFKGNSVCLCVRVCVQKVIYRQKECDGACLGNGSWNSLRNWSQWTGVSDLDILWATLCDYQTFRSGPLCLWDRAATQHFLVLLHLQDVLYLSSDLWRKQSLDQDSY